MPLWLPINEVRRTNRDANYPYCVGVYRYLGKADNQGMCQLAEKSMVYSMDMSTVSMKNDRGS